MGAAHNIRKLNGCVIDRPPAAADFVLDCFSNHNLSVSFLDIIAPVWVTNYLEPVLTATGNKIQPVISSSGDTVYSVAVDKVKKYNTPLKIYPVCIVYWLFHSSVVTVISHCSVSFHFLVSSFPRLTVRVLYIKYTTYQTQSQVVFSKILKIFQKL